jgi:hypothetical protein
MSYHPQTHGEITSCNEFYSYRRGWTDGAKATAMSKLDTSEEYKRGYSDGHKARNAALHTATERIGYDQRIIRLADSISAKKKGPNQ